MTVKFDFRAKAESTAAGSCADLRREMRAPNGWIFDVQAGDDGHPGVKQVLLEFNSEAGQNNFNYWYGRINDELAEVQGTICSDWGYDPGAMFHGVYLLNLIEDVDQHLFGSWLGWGGAERGYAGGGHLGQNGPGEEQRPPFYSASSDPARRESSSKK